MFIAQLISYNNPKIKSVYIHLKILLGKRIYWETNTHINIGRELLEKKSA